MKQVKFNIDKKEKSKVKEVRVGSDPGHVILVVSSEETDTLLSWNLEEDTENDAFDIDEEYAIIWDTHGTPFIVTERKIYFVRERCAITAYDYKGLLSDFNNNSDIQKYKGHRVDAKNHNWLILQGYMSLPFSYMTFVIKEKIEDNDPLQQGNKFDIEPWNYIFNKSTSFIEGNFVTEDHRQLEYVLSELEKIHPDHLEILHYVQDIQQEQGGLIKNSSLYKAEMAGNQRSIDIILNFMSKIPFNASRNFM